MLGRYYPVPSLVFGSYIVSMMVGISRILFYFCIVDLGMLSLTPILHGCPAVMLVDITRYLCALVAGRHLVPLVFW